MSSADAEGHVAEARSHLSDFEDASVEEQYGAIMHAIAALRNGKRELPEDY